MDKNNIIDIKNILQIDENNNDEKIISSKKSFKNQTNPVFRKNMLIIHNNVKFKVSDLFN